jgi:chorismate mutase
MIDPLIASQPIFSADPQASSSPLRLYGIRGATTLAQDAPEAFWTELPCLVEALMTANQLEVSQLVTVFVSITPDLTAISPAKVIREHFQWPHTPFFCAQEPLIVGLPARCVRLLLLAYTSQRPEDLTHVYRQGATILRPDLAHDGDGA